MTIKNVKTLFFDYDGTIHNSLEIYKPAFLDVYDWLVNQGYKKPRTWHDYEIKQFLGQNPKSMWESFGKGLPDEIRKAASRRIGKNMQIYMSENMAVLYERALETLAILKDRGYTLIFISNCTNAYMKAHIKAFNLDAYFTMMVNAETYDYISKSKILKTIMKDFDKDMAIIGDRYYDMQAGKENGIYTIGCTYGFGSPNELVDATMTIDSIETLLTIFKKSL
ncbi:MAG: HAD family hydrolase [Bacillota bacterium]